MHPLGAQAGVLGSRGSCSPRWEREHPRASPGVGARVELGTLPLTAPGLQGMGGNAELSGKWPPWPQAPQGSATQPGREGAA